MSGACKLAITICFVSDVPEFQIIETLTEGRTRRAIDASGNCVILKSLDPACLQHGRLHPNVKERLARIRELPVRDLALLHGVELVDNQPVLVWDDLGGQTLEQFVAHSRPAGLARDVSLLIDALHGHGIVHGAIHARNVIVDSNGRPRLTHLSPLLHYEPELDRADLAKMLDELGLVESQPVAAMPIERSRGLQLLRSASLWIAIGLATLAIVGGVWIYHVERPAVRIDRMER